MIRKTKKPESIKTDTIMGWRIAPPKLTFGALLVAMKYIIIPFLGGLALLDAALYFFFRHALDSCYGVLCLL
ncbi:MAG: hypothetical protein KUG56_06355 [Kordiimonadaceae bacterium]|nr:hypothetical protein [Kordiimonadaceae bacterium]